MAEHKPQNMEHYRRESEISAPVSDYEYFQFSPAVGRPPATPATTAAPPYTGGSLDSAIHASQHDHLHQSQMQPTVAEHHAEYPEALPAGKSWPA